MDSDGVITNFQCLCCASRYSFLCCLNECSLETYEVVVDTIFVPLLLTQPAFHRLPSHGNLRKHHLSHHAFSDVSPASIPSFVICEDRWSEFFSKWTRADQPSGHVESFSPRIRNDFLTRHWFVVTRQKYNTLPPASQLAC
ncbi:hypothetical protein M752DRAFT_25833 [Aspergillus phoenicis ATCC 13157]|uniref:Uncharacterized protein n=1 Tax=Aspergillus phoenicis ATCC 13157 TaxID=1353007 RepID=A0A370PHG6_ASPPH|nr:hypothetical protein M752DRAFT_25833 [Aspergillus phoenicis ATCC 13157]